MTTAPIDRILTRDPVYDTYVAGDDTTRQTQLDAATTRLLQAAYQYADVMTAVVVHRIRQHYPTAGRLLFHVEAGELYELADAAGRVLADADAIDDFGTAPSAPDGTNWESTLAIVGDYLTGAWEAAGETYFTVSDGYLDLTFPPA